MKRSYLIKFTNRLLILILYAVLFCAQSAQAKCLTFNIQSDAMNATLSDSVHFQLEKIQHTLHTARTHQQFHRAQDIIRNKVLKTLQPHGYFSPTVQVHLKTKPVCGVVNLLIKPGSRVKFKTIKLVCTTAQPCQHIRTALQIIPAQPGIAFTTQRYEDSLNQLLDIALQQGYFDAHASHSKLIIDPKHRTAVAQYQITLGKKMTVSQLRIQSNGLSHDLIRRYTHFTLNQPYSVKWLEQSRIDLLTSDYFNSVQIKPIWSEMKQHAVPVMIETTPKRVRTMLTGIGYDSDSEFKLLFGIRLRKINTLGHRAQATATLGTTDTHFNLKYEIPGYRPASDQIILETKRQSYLDRGFGHSRYWLNKIEFKRLTDQRMLGLTLNMRKEHSVPNSGQTVEALLWYPELNAFQEFKFPLSANMPAQFKLQAMARFALQRNHSATHFQQALLHARALLPITDDHQIVLTARMARSFVHALDDVPLSLQFATGGAQSIRGYAYNSLGPSKNLNTSSIEYRFRVKGLWYLSAFMDIANLHADFQGPWHQGVGMGLVWSSPMASISASIARAISLPQRPWCLQISVST
jgi:translocation and assembly module TamA